MSYLTPRRDNSVRPRVEGRHPPAPRSDGAGASPCTPLRSACAWPARCSLRKAASPSAQLPIAGKGHPLPQGLPSRDDCCVGPLLLRHQHPDSRRDADGERHGGNAKRYLPAHRSQPREECRPDSGSTRRQSPFIFRGNTGFIDPKTRPRTASGGMPEHNRKTKASSLL